MNVHDSPGGRFPAPLAQELVRALAHIDTRPASIVAADRAQAELLVIFDRHGHAAGAFLRVYHGITVAVLAALDAGELAPRRFFERLAGRFAEKHFDGVKAALGLDVTSDAARYRIWEPSFAFDGAPDRSGGPEVPLAHFLVGMCCHINFDLAVALEETIRELGLAGDAVALDAIERGHDFVDSILAGQVTASMQALADELGCPLSRMIVDARGVPLAGRAAMDVIRDWRARTFPAARELIAAPTAAARRRRREQLYREGAQRTAELFALLPRLMGLLRYPDAERALAAAVGWLPRAARDRAIAPGAPGRAAWVGRAAVRALDGAGLGAALHALQVRVIDRVDGALVAASRGVRDARMALGLLDVLVRLRRLGA